MYPKSFLSTAKSDSGSSTTLTVAHGLSSTEWLTVSNLEVNILDDNSTALFRFADYQTNRVFTTPSVFVIELTTSSAQFNTTANIAGILTWTVPGGGISASNFRIFTYKPQTIKLIGLDLPKKLVSMGAVFYFCNINIQL